jgi:hypothetical protein
MYIWQIKRLRQQLAIEGLVEKEAFYYYLGTAIIGALIYEAIANGPPTGAGAEPAATDYLDGILYVGFTIGGIIWCYLQNGGATGSDFLKRIVPIGWVMSWRYFALVIIFTAGLAAIRWQLRRNRTPGSRIGLGRRRHEQPDHVAVLAHGHPHEMGRRQYRHAAAQ